MFKKDVEDIEHFIFSCENVKWILEIPSKILKYIKCEIHEYCITKKNEGLQHLKYTPSKGFFF
jgi:hypothetical protein